MNRLSIEKRAMILRLLCEGMSMRATSRTVGVSINTVTKLLEDAGAACLDYQDTHLVDLNCKRIQCDEIWAFCYSKAKNVPAEKLGEFGYGDVWTWVALDAETKLVPCWVIAGRTPDAARDFMFNLAGRVKGRFQLTTDGLGTYLPAVEDAFGMEVDYAMLIKSYAAPAGHTAERKYSPGEVSGIKKLRVQGRPEKAHVSTSYIERQNLTMRMSMRRFTRLTNGFSKKVENHIHAQSLFYCYYNFARPHKSLKGATPAMAAGVANHVWTFEEIAQLSN
jgi:IS1 family transposase